MAFTVQCSWGFEIKVTVKGILTQFKRQNIQTHEDLLVANVIARAMRN